MRRRVALLMVSITLTVTCSLSAVSSSGQGFSLRWTILRSARDARDAEMIDFDARMDRRLPVSYEGAWYITRNNVCGETRAQKEFGIEPRPFEASVRDTLEWMAGAGRMKPSLFGKLVS